MGIILPLAIENALFVAEPSAPIQRLYCCHKGKTHTFHKSNRADTCSNHLPPDNPFHSVIPNN